MEKGILNPGLSGIKSPAADSSTPNQTREGKTG